MSRSAEGRATWALPTSTDEVHARAAGRRRYNALRRDLAQLRRIKLLQLVAEHGGLHRGVQARLARQLGVSEATISEDLRGILAGRDGPRRCPFCGCGGHPAPGPGGAVVVEDLDVDLDALADLLDLNSALDGQ